MMHGARPVEVSWLERHRRTWRTAKSELKAAWGVIAVVTCAAKLAVRPACSVVGRAARWRMGSWGRQKKRRPRRRCEDSWVGAIGNDWWQEERGDTLKTDIDRLARDVGGAMAKVRTRGPCLGEGSRMGPLAGFAFGRLPIHPP